MAANAKAVKGVKRKYTTITIPSPLFESIKKEIENTGFSSVSDYATYILRETVIQLKEKGNAEKGIKSKLEALGYR